MSIWANVIKRFTAPALPQATPEYNQQYFNQFLSILRLYFNQLDELLRQIVSAQPVNVNFYGGAIDAFGRARSSSPYTLFDSQNRYEKNDLWSEQLVGSATASYEVNKSTVNLNVTASSGDSVIRQTYRSFSYQPGKSLLVMNTFVMPTANASQRIRIGYFNAENGVFLERNGTAVRFVRRTYVSGAAVDTVPVEQADWNGDKLNGSGDSGFTLDLTKAQIFWQDFEWLGVGAVRCGFIIDGQIIVCHTFYNANNLTSVYMTTAILPVRYEITNTSGSTAATLQQICSTVISEGGYEKKVALNVARRTTTLTGIGTTFLPLVSIRLASGRTGAVVIPDGYSVLPTTSGDYEVALFKISTANAATALTGSSWVPSTSANVEYDVSASAINTAQATIVEQAFFATTNQASGSTSGTGGYNFDLQIGASISGTSEIYTLAIRALSGSQTAIASLSFWDLT